MILDGAVRIAFVSAPGSSLFMEEILAAVAEATRGVAPDDVDVVEHHGLVSEVVDGRTVAVVVPHEYYAVAPAEPTQLGDRVIAFGVEHPGTLEFERSVEHGRDLGARFEISQDSVDELARRSLTATLFPLGHVPSWDQWHGAAADRDVDLVYLGTADKRRLGLLAGAARAWTGLVTELLIPPHEPMTEARPDFLLGADKWRLLARSKVLVNLHRGEKTSLEWVRVLEAMHNGCVVVTEPSQDLGPLRPGVHLVVAEPDRIGDAAAELVADGPRRTRIAQAAYDLCRNELGMSAAAQSLLAAGRRLDRRPAPEFSSVPVARGTIKGWPDRERPMAGILPAIHDGPRVEQIAHGRRLVTVLCASLAGDGRSRPRRPRSRPSCRTPVHVALRRAPGRASATGSLERSDEPFLAVLDAGDALIGDALERMADLLRGDPGLDAVLCPATYGDTLVNVLLPDEQRLRASASTSPAATSYAARRSRRSAASPRNRSWPAWSTTTSGSRSPPAVAAPRCCAGSVWRWAGPVSPSEPGRLGPEQRPR